MSKFVAFLMMVFVASAVLTSSLLGLVYVTAANEDTAPVWMCSVMGNGQCGPDEPWVSIR